jgi:transporter family protein
MKAILFAVGAGVCWGVGEVITKTVLHTGKIGPVTALAVRSTVAIPLLWLAYVLVVHWVKLPGEPRTWLQTPAPVMTKLLLGGGLLAGGLGMICFYVALNLGEISRIKPIAFTLAPAIAVTLGWLALGEEMTLRKVVAVMMVLTGVVLLAWK